MKTTNISKTKPRETKVCFMSPFTPSGREIDQPYSTAPGVHTGQQMSRTVHVIYVITNK